MSQRSNLDCDICYKIETGELAIAAADCNICYSGEGGTPDLFCRVVEEKILCSMIEHKTDFCAIWLYPTGSPLISPILSLSPQYTAHSLGLLETYLRLGSSCWYSSPVLQSNMKPKFVSSRLPISITKSQSASWRI